MMRFCRSGTSSGLREALNADGVVLLGASVPCLKLWSGSTRAGKYSGRTIGFPVERRHCQLDPATVHFCELTYLLAVIFLAAGLA
jgi:hypothetical protein